MVCTSTSMPTTAKFMSACQSTMHIRVVVHNCVHDITECMTASRLRLNPTKTQVIWVGSSQQLKHVDINDIPVLSNTVLVVERARDLGVILASRLTLSAPVTGHRQAGCYQLRQLRPLVLSMTAEAVRTVAAAFIYCRLDYCNSLLYGLRTLY